MKTTKPILLTIVFVVMAILHAGAQIPVFAWAKQNSGGTDIRGYSIALDGSGNQIITGYFNGTVDFDPGVGVLNLTSNGNEDIFIQKLDPMGNLLWAFSIGDTASDWGWSIVTDSQNNIYTTGYFYGTIDVDPGPGTYYLTQQRKTALVLKLGPSGNLIWAKQMGSDNIGHAWGYAIALDNNQNVVTSGTFVGKVDFDPGPGTYYLTSKNGTQDVFIQKLDNDGNFVWVKQLTGTGNIMVQSMVLDASENIYTGGSFSGTIDFNPDPARKATFNMTSDGSADAFIAKLDANGNFIWAKKASGPEGIYGYCLAIDPGYIYFTGQFYGTGDFDPGSGSCNLTSFGESDMFLQKLDLDGNFVWAKQYGGSGWNSGNHIAADAAGNIYATGFTYETADFDPDPVNTYNITADGHDDIFILKSDASGNLLYVSRIGGPGWDYATALEFDDLGGIHIVGSFQHTVDVDPGGNGVYEMTAPNDRDMVLLKLNASGGDNCPVPTGLQAASITETTAVLSWSTVTGTTGYTLRYREADTTLWVVLPGMVTGTTMTLNGLTAATTYEFQVRTNCYSNYSYSGEFTTVGGGCEDVYEPNETLATAAAIPVNSDIHASIATATDIDWFSFANSASSKNIMIMLTNLPADYDVALYKSDGTQVGISQNRGTANEEIIFNNKKVGTYYIRVYGYNGAYNPNYCYTLQAALSSSNYKSLEAEDTDPDRQAGLIIYPNPAINVLNISFHSSIDENITLRLLDLSGKTVKGYTFNAVEGINQFEIDLDDLSAGIYMMGLMTGSGNYFRKVVIQK